MMMGVGNLTELTDVDSAGVNTLLDRVLPGAGRPQRPDDRRDQLGPHLGPRDRPGPAARPSRRRPGARCPSTSSRGWSCSATPRSRGSAPRTWPSCSGGSRTPTGGSSPRTGRSTRSTTPHFLERRRPVPPLRADGRDRPVARLLPRLRADEGEDRPDAEQELSPGSGARVGLPDRARGEPPRPPQRTRTATRRARA